MRASVRDWIERVAPDRGDLLAVAVSLVGCVVATLVAVRVPLLAAWERGGDGAAGGPVASASVTAGTPEGTPTAVHVVVHVTGAVRSPGVVELPAGARVADAVEAAGGARADAVLAGLNLARPLDDGEQVVVPVVPGPAADGAVAGAASAGAAVPDPSRLPDGRLDLNAATAEDLEQLPGVGPVLAERIVTHRAEHGPFTRPAGLLDVSGIGDATWARLRELVGVR